MNEHTELSLKPCCQHLRHKMMFCDERHDVPGMVDDSSDTRVFFCAVTQESLSPIGDPVSPTCCTTERECYRSIIIP